MEILFQNESFVAVDKPAGWLSVPARFKDERKVLGLELEREIGGKVFPCHRLDAEVSGIILFALHEEAHRAANSWFENHLISKTYEALTESKNPAPAAEPQIWKSKLVRGKKRTFEAEHGKESITHAQFTGKFKNSYRWLLKPQTGRPHQLRVELAKRGFPILGDSLYGSTLLFWEEGIALRSIAIEFPDDAAEFQMPALLKIAGFSS